MEVEVEFEMSATSFQLSEAKRKNQIKKSGRKLTDALTVPLV